MCFTVGLSVVRAEPGPLSSLKIVHYVEELDTELRIVFFYNIKIVMIAFGYIIK
jgi:hypothetical protein